MSDVKVQQKQTLSRQEAARFIAALAAGLGEDGKVTVRLGSSTLEVSVASQLDLEFEVEVDGDEIELELELKWSTSGRASAEAAEDRAEDVASGEEPEEASGPDDPEVAESGSDDPEVAESGSDDPEVAESGPDAPVQGPAREGESDEDAVPGEGGAVRAAEPDRSAEPRRGRRRAPAGAGGSAGNGVDPAAVRAWATATGLTVSPRGRIKAEVLEAYRAAGN